MQIKGDMVRQNAIPRVGNNLARLGRPGAALWCCLALVVAVIAVQRRAGAQEPAATDAAQTPFPPAVTLLSNSTQGMVAIDDLPRLLEQWTKTSLSDLQHDEAMQAFLDSQRDKITDRLADMGLKSGIRLSDLRDAVSGELVFAWTEFDDPQRPFSVAMVADTRGRDGQRASMLEKVDRELRGRGATVSAEDIGGHRATMYTMPQKQGQLVVNRLIVVEFGGRLVISDRLETATSLVSAALEGSQGGLIAAEDYQAVFEKIDALHQQRAAAAQSEPSVRWFARPIGMGMIARQLAGVDRGRQVDVLKLLRNQGFEALQAAGGRIRLATDHYDLLHEGFVYAPPTVPGPERYKMAARILQFPNVEMSDPPAWVPATAAVYFQVHWNLQEAFWATETLVDEAMGGDVFRPMLEGIKEDPNGPQIDIEKDVVANFGQDLYIVTDNRVTDGTTQERVVGAIRIENSERVAEVVNEAMERDPFVFRFPYDEHIVWEVRPEEVEDGSFDVTGLEELGFGLEAEAQDAPPSEPLLDKWALTVYGDYLMFASHAELLVDLVEHAKGGQSTLADDPTYIRVRDAIVREGGELRSMQRVVQTDLAWRVKYQLLREGKFLESDSLLATLIRRAQEEAETAPRPDEEPLEIDMSQLPPFAEISDHLQPSGGFLKTDEQGWSMTQFLLRSP